MADFAYSVWQDIKFGFRMLRKTPAFTAAVVAILALGIGGNTAIFTITNALLLRALPYPKANQLVLVQLQKQGNPDAGSALSLNLYEHIRDHSRSFSGLAVFANDSLVLTGRGEPQQVPVARVSPNFLDVLGIRPELGRNFTADEGQVAGNSVVILSNNLWRSRFASDPNIVGKTVRLDASSALVVGVLPDVQFPFLGPADVFTPRYFELSLTTPEHLRAGVGYLNGVARLNDHVSVGQASAELAVVHRQYAEQFPKAPDAGSDETLIAGNLQELTVANVHALLLMLSLAVALVLLIACANVASLLLARALARSKEVAIRMALGAKRSSIVRQFLVESMLLAIISGAIGVAVGAYGTRALVRAGSANLPAGFDIAVDRSVLLFAFGITTLTGLLFGIFPAIKVGFENLNSELRDESRGSTGRHRFQLKNALLVAQIAFSVVLLISASLMVRSLARLQRVELGFDPTNVLTMDVSLPTVKYAKPDQQIAFFDELLRKVRSVPGVSSASISAALPLNFRRITPALPEGQPELPLPQRPFIIIEVIGNDWFQTMRVPLSLGRSFNDHDTSQSPKVIIVNSALARHYWPNENPIGKHIAIGRREPAEVVGLAGDVRNSGIASDARPQIYLPFTQLPWADMNLLVRSAGDPHQFVSVIRQQVYAVDPDQPVTGVQTLDELLDGSRAQPRFTAFLLGTLSALAILLAIAGIYGAILYMVAQRRPEMGIRIALGASREDILKLVMSSGVVLSAIGIGIGLVAALATTRFMSSLLYQVKTHDLTSFLIAPLTFLLIAAVATYLPARQATKVDPSELFRSQ